jgi:hypothetical protein
MWLVDTSTSRGCNFCIQYPFGALGIPLEMCRRELHIMNGPLHVYGYQLGAYVPKKHQLGTQNGPESLGLEQI